MSPSERDNHKGKSRHGSPARSIKAEDKPTTGKKVPAEVLNRPPQICAFDKDELLTEESALDLTLTSMVINAIPTTYVESYKEKTQLHWRTAFEVPVKMEKTRYVVVDATFDAQEEEKYGTAAIPAVMLLKTVNYKDHKDSMLKYECALKKGTKLRHILELLEGRLGCFRYNSDGNGCFHWVKEFFKEMSEKAMFQSRNDAEKISRELGSFRKDQVIENDYIIPGSEGTFYTRNPSQRHARNPIQLRNSDSNDLYTF